MAVTYGIKATRSSLLRGHGNYLMFKDTWLEGWDPHRARVLLIGIPAFIIAVPLAVCAWWGERAERALDRFQDFVWRLQGS